nr:type VII secretion protein EsaA [Priestia taiwanensis]
MRWSILLFIALVLTISSSTSYLAVNHVAVENQENKVERMTIALVNEDQGSSFEGEQIDFGSQFVKNVTKDTNHEWYVVSRGVAENGLTSNNYNMMIVIPNDFSQKALTINEEVPEKVMLTYKVNATGDNAIKEKAETAATVILEDFNKRIIDVYFASIIGKLQDAQDNISTVIKKGEMLAGTYESNIHNPLANYTNQFKSIHSYTNESKGSFENFQGILESFKSRINSSKEQNVAYQNQFSNFMKLQEDNKALPSVFTQNLTQFNQTMSTDDVMKQLARLETTNTALHNQFQSIEGQSTLLSKANALQVYIQDVNGKIIDYDTDLTAKLEGDVQAKIKEKLMAHLTNKSGKDQDNNDAKDLYLYTFFQQPSDTVNRKVESLINKLPSMSVEEIEQLDLLEDTKNELKNVMLVAAKYNEENDHQYQGGNKTPLAETIEKVKASLTKDGISFTDSDKVGKMESEQTFTLNIPKGFYLPKDKESLKIDGKDYTAEYIQKGSVTLPAREEGNINVQVHLQLEEGNKDVDIFNPVNWQWTLKHHNEKTTVTEDGGTEKPTDPPTDPLPPPDKPDTATKNIHAVDKPEDPSSGNGSDPTPPTDPTPPDNGNGTDKPTDPTPPDNGDGTDKPTDPTPPKNKETLIERTNDYLKHTKTEDLHPNTTNVFVKDAIKTVKSYQQLSSLLNLYYGLDMENADLQAKLAEGTLQEIATEDSLYYMFNKQSIVDAVSTYVASEITAEVTEELNTLKTKVTEYLKLVEQVNADSGELTTILTKAISDANEQNTHVTKLLGDLKTWRDTSMKLLEEQGKINIERQNEQQKTIELDSGFKTLLAEAERLSADSENTELSADQVYETFERINTEADKIQLSGENVVSEASNLLTEFDTKMFDDKNFAKNFTQILANSRIGDEQNEHLYEFLSNPVQKKNDGTIVGGDLFTPYLIVIVCFIVALFTAYVTASQGKKHRQKNDFEEEQSIAFKNLPVTAVTACIAIVEGVIIGAISGRLLEFQHAKYLMFIGMITLIMLAFVLVSTYLLRQIKMVGMFVILIFLSIYLFLTDAVGVHIDKSSYLAKIREFSPLHFTEGFLYSFISDEKNWHIAAFVFAILSVVAFVANLFVIKFKKEGEGTNDETKEQVG